MDFPTSTPSSNFDYIADAVDTSFLQSPEPGITDYLTGNYGTVPGTQPQMDQISSGMDAYVNAKPTYQAANQPTYYNPEGLNFDRYSQSTYFGLKGFSPELGRENEYRYGQMQTWGDMMGNAFAGAYKLGAQTFVDGWKGWGRMTDALVNLDATKLVGNPDELLDLHKEQEAIMNKYAIFATPESEQTVFNKQLLGNMVQQSGFAIGATAQFLSEELLTMGLSSAFSLGKLGISSAARVAKGAYKTGELISDAKKLGDIWKYDNVVTSIWNGAKKLVPLAGTVDDVAKASRAGASALQLASIGVGGIKRSLAELNMAMTEARMEAAGTYGDLYTRMTRDFKAANGRAPYGEELEDIKSLAFSAAQDNFKVNTGVLAVMNRIQFDNLFSKFGTERRIMKAFGELGDDVIKVTGKVGEKEATRVAKAGISGLGDIASTFGKKRAAWEGTKQLGKAMSKWEVSEGIQELIQEGSNVAMQDYYMDLYNGETASWNKSVAAGAEAQMSKEGFKTFLMGALTGRMISPITGLIGKGTDLLNTTAEQRAERKATLEESIGLINNFYENPNLALNEAIANFKVQNKAAENMTEALKNRDAYYYNNAKDSALAKLVSAAIKTDMLESVVDTIKAYGENLTPEQMKEAFVGVDPSNDNIDNAKGYFSKIASEIEDFAKNWEYLNDTYGDIVMPELYEEGTEERKQAQIAKKAVQDAIEVLATNRFKGERAQERMQKIYNEVQQNKVIGNSSAAAFRILGSDELMQQEIQLIQAELAGLEAVENKDDATKAQIKAKKAELDAITAWKESWLPAPDKSKGAMMNTPALKKAYADYVSAKNVSNRIDQKVSNTDVDNSWTSFMDYVNLNQDMTQFTDAYNTLANPMAFTKMVNSSRDAITALLDRLKNQAIEEATNAAGDKTRNKVTLTFKDKEGKEHELEISENGRYITEADPIKRLSPEGQVKDTYNQDVIYVKRIVGDSITVEINGDKNSITYTLDEFVERAGRLWDLKTMEPAVRMYFMNRDKEFTISVRTKTGKPHKVGGKHASKDYSNAGVEVAARLELEKEEDGKYHLKVTYTNPYTKEKESFPYNPKYMAKYRVGVTDLTTLPELEEGLAAQAEQRRKDALALQLETLEELIDEQETNIANTKATAAMTRTEVDELKKELDDLLFVAEELEKLDPKDAKTRNQLKKLVNIKKVSDLKAKIPALKARIAELEERSAQLESEIDTMEELYMTYLEAQQELQTEGEAYDREGRETIYTAAEEKLGQLKANQVEPEVSEEEFSARIQAIQEEKDLIDDQITYLKDVVAYLENIMVNFTDFQDIMDVLGDNASVTMTSSVGVLPTTRGKVSPEKASKIYDIDKIRKGLILVKQAENAKDNPNKEKIATIDYMLAGLALENDKVFDETKLNAIDAITFAQKIERSKDRLRKLTAEAATLQQKIDLYTRAVNQRQEIGLLQNRVDFLKKLWEPLANRAKRKMADKKVKMMVSQAQLKEQNKKLASVALDQDPESPVFKNGAKSNFARTGFRRTFGSQYTDRTDTELNRENGSDRFYNFTANVPVKGKNYVLRVVTKANAERLGLSDIRDVAFNEDDIKVVVMKRVAKADGSFEYKYVGMDGNVLSDEAANDKENLIYRSLPNIKKYDVNRIRSQEDFAVDERITDDQIEKRLTEHEAYQQQLVDRTANEDVFLEVVGTTPGVQRVQRLENGEIEKAPVDGRVIEEDSDYTTMRSATNRDALIELRVSTSKDQSAGVGILPGRVIMQEYYFDEQGTKVRTEKVFRVFNRPLEDSEKDNLAAVLTRFSELFGRNYSKDEAQKLSESEKAEFDMILSYLTGVLPWGIPSKQAAEVSDRFFWVDNGLHRGSQVIEFSENGIRLNKDLLFEGMFHHVNHLKLTKNEPYATVKIVDGKAVADKKYDSYSAYLLAKREDGSTPPVYTSLPRVDSEFPQRSNVQLMWNDPSAAPELEINLEPKERKDVTAGTADRKQIEAGIDALIDGTATEAKIFGFTLKVEKVNEGFTFKITRVKNNVPQTKELFPQPVPTLETLQKSENRKKVYELIKKATGFGYGEKSVLDSLGGVKTSAPVAAGTDERVELQKLQGAIRATTDLTGMMDSIFDVLDEKEYEIWQHTLTEQQIVTDLGPQIQGKTEIEAAVIVSRYLLDKFIDKKLKDLGPVQGKTAPTLNPTQTLSTATVAQSTLLSIATKVSKGQPLSMAENITYQKNKAQVDAVIAQNSQPAAGKVQTQPVAKPNTSLPLDITTAVAQAKQEGDKLTAAVYTVNQAGESKVLYSASTTIPNGNIALAKANLQSLLEEQHETDLGDFRIAFRQAEETEDFAKLTEFMQANLPQVPVSVMSHLINGKAWGQFLNGAIYIYKNAEIGTGFHEAFEAVYKSYLTREQQDGLSTEFRGRTGTFYNPFTKETKNYADATDFDVKEMLAEEFRAYVLSNGQKAPEAPKLKSFFQKLWDMIQKLLGLTPQQDQEMSGYINSIFKQITTGGFAKATPIRERNYSEPELRAVGGFTQQETSDLVEGLTYYFFTKIYEKGSNIDSLLGDMTKDESSALFNELYSEAYDKVRGNTMIKSAAAAEQMDIVAAELKTEFKNFVSRFGLQFDEDSFAKEDNATDTLGIRDSMTIDPRKGSKLNIKLLLASLPMYDYTADGKVKVQKNGMMQPKLVDFDRTITLLLNELGNVVVKYDANGNQIGVMDQMMEKLDKLYLEDNGNYRNGYTWIKNMKKRLKYGEQGLSLEDMMLQTAFTANFTNVRIAPEKLIFNEDGQIYNFNPLQNRNTDRVKDNWSNNIKDTLINERTIWKVGTSGMIEIDPLTAKYGAMKQALNARSSFDLNKALEMLKLFGVEFSHDIAKLQPYAANIIDDTINIMRLTLDGQIKNAIDLFSGEIVSARMNRLLNLEANFSGEENILSYNNASGMPKYAVSIPSLFSNTVNTLNSVKNLTELVQTSPWLGFVDSNGQAQLYAYQANSLVLKKDGILFDKNGVKRPGVKVTFHDISGVGMNEADGVDTADLQFPDRAANKIHYIMKNVTFSNINSDKSTEFGLGFTKGTEAMKHAVLSTDVKDLLYGGGSDKIMNIFMDQLRDEVTAAVIEKLRPSNIEVYSDAVMNLGHFEDILKPSGLLGKFQKEMNKKSVKMTDGEKFLKNNETEIKAAITKYLETRIDETVDFLTDLDLIERIPNSSDYATDAISNSAMKAVLGIAPGDQNVTRGDFTRAFFTPSDIRTYAGFLALNEEIMIAEQHKLIYGHPSMYKDLPKRANGPTATKEEMVQDDTVIGWMDENMPRVDGKVRAEDQHQTMKIVTFEDQSVISEHYQDIAEGLFEMLRTALGDKAAMDKIGAKFNKEGKFTGFVKNGDKYTGLIKAYVELNEADGMAYGMPDMVRDILFKTGKLSKDQIKQFDYEMAYEKLVRSGRIAGANGEKMTKDNPAFIDDYAAEELDAAMNVYKKGDPGYIFQVLKTQYFGYAAGKEVDGLDSPAMMTHPVFLKHSVQPKFFRHVEGTQFEKVYLAAQANGVDVLTFQSGEKVGNVTTASGQAVPLYKADGTVNIDGLNFPSDMPIQQLYSRFFGIQVSTADYAKDKVVRGTQVTKLIMVNFFENGFADPEIANIIREYNDTLVKMMKLGKEELLEELGLEDQGERYVAKDLSRLVSILRREAISRDLPDNMIDAINAEELIDGTSQLQYDFDTLINREKIDNILNSIVDSRVISAKMSGKAAIQVSSAMYEKDPRKFMVERDGVYVPLDEALKLRPLSEKEQRTVRMVSNDLKSYYRKDGSVQRMEVYINWPFGDLKPEALGLKLEDGVYKIPEGFNRIDKVLLEGIGFRIPTQSMNSIEAIVIKGFVPSAAGDMVVVPSDLVGKAGSDFDIDKLNIYIANFSIDDRSLQSPRFRSIVSEYLQQNHDWTEEMTSEVLDNIGKETLDRINKATFTDNGREFHEADESLEDIALEMGGKNAYEKLRQIKKAIQSYNRARDKYMKEKGGDEYGIFLKAEPESDTKKGLQNKLIRLMGELVLHESNYRQLVTPNNVDTLKGLATEITAMKEAAGTISKQNEKSRSYLRSFVGNTRIRERYLTAKRMVGISALHSTFHAMAQVSGLQVNDVFDITQGAKFLMEGKDDNYRSTKLKLRSYPANENGTFNIGYINDISGVAISDSFSEATSGFVDGAKDPFVFDLNLSMDTAGTWLSTKHRGADDRDLAFFFAQPILDEFFAAQAKNKSMFKKANGRNEYKADIFYQTVAPYFKRLKGVDILAEMKRLEEMDSFKAYEYKKSLAKQFREIADRFEQFTVSEMETAIKKGTKAEPAYQIAVLYEYIMMETQARHMSNFIQAISYDNKKTKTIYENEMQVANWDRAVKVGYIANPEAILENTFIGEMKNQKEDLFKLFREFFITLDPAVRPVFQPLEEFLSDPDYVNSKEGSYQLISRYQNFVVAYMLHTTPYMDENGQQKRVSDMYETLLKGADSMGNQLMKYKISPDPRISKNLVIQELLPLLSDDVNKPTNLRLLRSRLDSIKINKIIESVNQLREFAVSTADKNLKDFVDNLAVFSILQSGVQASSLDFKKVLPVEVYSNLVRNILQNFKANPYLDPADVWKQFHQNNFSNRTIVPKFPSYAKVKNNVITIGATSAVSRYQYMVKYLPKFGLTMKEAMAKGAEGFSPRLFERTMLDSKGKWVYAPIDKKGDGRRFLEIYPDARESMINENNVKMKMTPGTSMSDGGWIKFEDPDFFASIYAGVTPQKTDGFMELEAAAPVEASTNKVIEGDIFAIPGIPVITTNLGGVHGAGLAQLAKNRGLIKQGDGNYKATGKVVQLPVKKVWSDSMAMNNNMGLLAESLDKLKATANENPENTYLLPLAGLGHGEGKVSEILPMLIDAVKKTPNIKLVLPASNVNLGRQGTVRQDSTREKMPEIQKMLAEAGLVSSTAPVIKSTQPTGNTIKFDGPGNVEKILAGTKTITNRTEKGKLKGDGIYKVADSEVSVEIKLLGKADVQFIGDGGFIEFEDGKIMGLDEYAKAEGFKDWADFNKNNNFSSKFVDGLESRFIYSVKPVGTPAVSPAVNEPKNALAQNLLRQALGKPSADADTIKKLNDKENESKNCNS